jgi:hypothetical protein
MDGGLTHGADSLDGLLCRKDAQISQRRMFFHSIVRAFITALGIESNDHGMAKSRAQPDLNVGGRPVAAEPYPRCTAPFGVTAHGLDSRADVCSLGSRVYPALRQALHRSLAPNDYQDSRTVLIAHSLGATFAN